MFFLYYSSRSADVCNLGTEQFSSANSVNYYLTTGEYFIRARNCNNLSITQLT